MGGGGGEGGNQSSICLFFKGKKSVWDKYDIPDFHVLADAAELVHVLRLKQTG